MLGQLEEVRGEDDLLLGYLWLLIATDNLPIIKASLLPFQELEDSYFFWSSLSKGVPSNPWQRLSWILKLIRT